MADKKKREELEEKKKSLRERREKIEEEACKTHNKIGKIVRNAIKQAGGTIPEDLPTQKNRLKIL